MGIFLRILVFSLALGVLLSIFYKTLAHNVHRWCFCKVLHAKMLHTVKCVAEKNEMWWLNCVVELRWDWEVTHWYSNILHKVPDYLAYSKLLDHDLNIAKVSDLVWVLNWFSEKSAQAFPWVRTHSLVLRVRVCRHKFYSQIVQYIPLVR